VGAAGQLVAHRLTVSRLPETCPSSQVMASKTVMPNGDTDDGIPRYIYATATSKRRSTGRRLF